MANPFAVAFFAALFPQFIDTGSNTITQLIILGATYIVVDGCILYAWGMAGVKATKSLEAFKFSIINKVSGALMIVAAGFLAHKDIEPRHS